MAVEEPSTVAVVGGGAVGVTAARDLADRGVEVVLYERDELAAGSSGRAAGICYAAFADRRDARLAERAQERFRGLDGDDGFAFEPCPYVWLAREGDDRRAGAVREGAERMRDHGLPVEVLDGDALGEQFPALRTDDVAVAAVAGEGAAGYADPGAYVRAMGARAERAGVDLREGTGVGVRADPPRVVVADGPDEGTERRYGAVVVAAGAHAPGLLAAAGIEVPVKPYRVQALVTDCELAAPMCYDATGSFYLRPHPEGLLAGDGTEPVEADPETYDRSADGWFREELAAGLAHRLGDGGEIRRSWAGLCTATPDHDPLVGPVAPGVFVATGWQGHGFMRAPAVGERLAEQVLGGAEIAGFDPGRFDGDEEFEVREGMEP